MHSTKLIDYCKQYQYKLPKRLPKEINQFFSNTLNYYNRNTSFNKHPIISVRNLIFIVSNQLIAPPICKMCSNLVNWQSTKKRYAFYCSNSCQQTDPTYQKNHKIAINKIDFSLSVKKRQQTNLQRYDNTNYLASNVGKAQVKQALNIKYGVDYISQIPEIQYKKHNNALIRYGVDHPSKTLAVKEKIKQTNIERYGRGSWAQQHLSVQTMAKLNGKQWLYQKHIVEKCTLAEISIRWCNNVDTSTISRYMSRHGIDVVLNNCARSRYEIELVDFLKSLNCKNIITNDRDILHGRELDIVLPDQNIAIEFCGVYWHNDTKVDPKYHYQKMLDCEKNHYQLLTIFEPIWNLRKSQVKHAIAAKLGKLDTLKINARDTTFVDNISISERNSFLDINHIQGSANSSFTFALKHNNNIVAIISFLKAKNVLILNRYCTNCNVRGGFSKLLKNSIKFLPNCPIITFADRCFSTGALYENNYFKLVELQTPNYWYSYNSTTWFHRFSFRKKYLSTKLNFYDPSKTEFENCNNNGIFRLWDCGLKKYQLIDTF